MLLALMSASGCATSGQGNFCDNAKPIYFDTADRMSERTERAIITHNEKGAALCGWK